MIRAIRFSQHDAVVIDPSDENISAELQKAEILVWVDMVEEPPQNCEPLMKSVFKFHALAVEDALKQSHIPKLDDWGEYIYMVLHAIRPRQHDLARLRTQELDVFLGQNYLVTHHDHTIFSLDRLWEACLRKEKPLFFAENEILFHRLSDEVASDYATLTDRLDEMAEMIESQVINQANPRIPEQLFALKRALLALRRVTAPQREVYARLSSIEYDSIEARYRVLLRDVYDHYVRLHNTSESLRDLVSSVTDIYLSVVNNQLSSIMKILTIFTALLMPLSFLTSFYGMNFFQPAIDLSPWTGRAAFIILMALMVILPVVMIIWMRRQKWL